MSKPTISVLGGKTFVLVALLALVMFALSACGGNVIEQPREQEDAQQEPAASEDNGANDSSSDDGASDGGASDGGASDGGASDDDSGGNGGNVGGSSDGGNEVYQVGDAGEVELRIEDGGLVLVEVRPNDGWNFEIDDEDRDEIDIDFRRGDEEWEFEAELDDGALDIEIDRDIDD